jgi:plastocyanin domain-containing protein
LSRTRTLTFAALLFAGACSKKEPPAPPPPLPEGRHVVVQVTGMGYRPDHIEAQPGEKLALDFQAQGWMGCCDKIVIPSLSLSGEVKPGHPWVVGVTVPQSGKLAFACSMDMCKGQIGLASTDASP